jgi:pyridoxal phosphate enzyme (YggS family)
MTRAETVAQIEERIHRACAVSGKKREEITLMGVSKFHPVEAVIEAWDAGIRCFGESRVREGAVKFRGFREARAGTELHLIGSLQRNKAREAAFFFDCIQSVDRESLIGELGKHASLREAPLPVLLELRTAEESKSGFTSPDELFRAAELILACPALSLRGLMTIAPNTQDMAPVRAAFRQAALARRELERRFPPRDGWNWSCLSMGMSGDFETAIAEGATLLRIGSALFGERS